MEQHGNYNFPTFWSPPSVLWKWNSLWRQPEVSFIFISGSLFYDIPKLFGRLSLFLTSILKSVLQQRPQHIVFSIYSRQFTGSLAPFINTPPDFYSPFESNGYAWPWSLNLWQQGPVLYRNCFPLITTPLIVSSSGGVNTAWTCYGPWNYGGIIGCYIGGYYYIWGVG